MTLTTKQKENIIDVIKTCLRDKFKKYKPESNSMPFHHRLLGKDRMALYSFMQSLNTTFGTSIFEPVAIELAKNIFIRAEKQASAGNKISEEAQTEIQNIIDNIATGKKSPNKTEEINAIKKIAVTQNMKEVKLTKIDILLEDNNNNLYLFDIKTAKPNIGEMKGYKRTLLEWVATEYVRNGKINSIQTIIAIPYNPYEPKPYERWTMKGILDIENELKVSDEFWDFLGGEGCYSDLLECFEIAGIDLREEIDKYFEKFK